MDEKHSQCQNSTSLSYRTPAFRTDFEEQPKYCSRAVHKQGKQRQPLRKKKLLNYLSLVNLIEHFLLTIPLIKKKFPEPCFVQYLDKMNLLLIKQLNQHQFNEDQFIFLYNTRKLTKEHFAEESITPMEHRALAMIIYAFRGSQFAILTHEKFQRGESKMKQKKGPIQRKFYATLYELSGGQYYKLLLNNEIQYCRYRPKDEPNPRRVHQNLVRVVMGKVYQKNFMKDQALYQQILGLEEQINVVIASDKILSHLRIKVREESKRILNNYTYAEPEKRKQRNQKVYEQQPSGEEIQEEEIQEEEVLIEEQEKVVKEVREEDEQKQLNIIFGAAGEIVPPKRNMYKGYRGFKSNARKVALRKWKKGIKTTAMNILAPVLPDDSKPEKREIVAENKSKKSQSIKIQQ